MKIITEQDNLKKLSFPSRCLRCFKDSAKERLQIIETNFLVRSLHNPFSIISILLFLIVGGFIAVLDGLLEVNLIWTWLFAYVLLFSFLRDFSEKSCRLIELVYCRSCLKKWERSINIDYGLKFIFIIGSSVAFYLGVHRAFPAVLPAVWAISFLLLFLGKGVLYRYDPPIDMRKSKQNTITLDLGNSGFAKETIGMNNILKDGFDCKDCGAFVSVSSNKCPKCIDIIEE
ncbi:MAG: hypothetical protein ACE5GN_04810 [Waddliaceae bacterium]